MGGVFYEKKVHYKYVMEETNGPPHAGATDKPKKFAQMRSTNLLLRVKGRHIDSGGSNVEALVKGEVESSVLYCNLTKTSLHPQLTKSPTTTMTSHQLPSPPTCQFCSQRATLIFYLHINVCVHFCQLFADNLQLRVLCPI